MSKLGVNIDHIATLRQARRETDPDPIAAAVMCEKAGADSIVAHLREDRRHIQDIDIVALRKIIKTRFNLEMSLNPGVVRKALIIKPDVATIVPERRQEVTTEGGLDVIKFAKKIEAVMKKLQDKRIAVSLFIDPNRRQIETAREIGAQTIELHTGKYAEAKIESQIQKELENLRDMTNFATSRSLTVNAGHGLKYHNTKAIAQIHGLEELNIGHSIISRSVFVGLETAVKEMIQIIKG